MKSRFSSRPFAALSLVVGLALAPAVPASAAAASAAPAVRAARAAAPAAPSALQSWVHRLLAAVGLAPNPSPGAPTTPNVPPPVDTTQNGAGIDPNG